MTGVSLGSSFGDLAVYALDAGCCYMGQAAQNARAGNRRYTVVSGLIGLGFLAIGVGASVLPIIACQGNCTGGQEEGDSWMGHCYPWSQFPHGHLDCVDGSVQFHPVRSQYNEQKRIYQFASGYCVRGKDDLSKVFGSLFMICFSNGTMISKSINSNSIQNMRRDY